MRKHPVRTMSNTGTSFAELRVLDFFAKDEKVGKTPALQTKATWDRAGIQRRHHDLVSVMFGDQLPHVQCLS